MNGITKVLLLSSLLSSNVLSQTCSNEDKVLFFGDVSSPCAVYETYITNNYPTYAVDHISSTSWSSLTEADFDLYRAIIFCDPDSSNELILQPAVDNQHEWTPVIDGNILLIGTDERGHYGSGGQGLIENGLTFVLDDTCDKTGLYVSFSEYYDGHTNENVDLLDGFGTFTANLATGCFNDAHIVAEHPVLDMIDDTDLSSWSCSVHNVFLEYPNDFIPLAIAEDEGLLDGTAEEFGDGSFGIPYILVRGDDVTAVGACGLTSCQSDECTDECEDGFFQASFTNAYECANCSQIFGEACLSCTNYHGCTECACEYELAYLDECDLYGCVEEVCEDCPVECPIELDDGGVCIAPCDTYPCSCNDDCQNCDECHENGCNLCEPGYFKKDYNHPCVQCQEYFGDACMFCQDFDGCGQCQSGYQREYNTYCELWECQ